MYNGIMRVGLSTATFFGKILTEDCPEFIKGLGVDCAEVFLTTFSEYEESFTERMAADLHGIEVYSVHSLNNHYEPELYNRVARTRSDAENIFYKVCSGARKLGASNYIFHGPSRLKIMEYRLNYERVGVRAEELAVMAASFNVKLCYENVSWAYYNSPGFFSLIRRYAPSLKACLDIKQAMQSYRNMEGIKSAMTDRQYHGLMEYTLEYLDDMDASLNNVHLCDYDINGNLCPPGKGIFDFPKLIQALKRKDYGGPLMIELYSEDYDTYEEIKDSIRFLKSIIGGTNE